MLTHFYPITKDFDEILDNLSTNAYKNVPNYPPYNIYEENDKGAIEIAVTGLSKDNIQIYFDEDNFLVVEGKYPNTDTEKVFKHKGLSKKDFIRKFRLEKNYDVHSADVNNGLLVIKLKKEQPERQLIPIGSTNTEELND